MKRAHRASGCFRLVAALRSLRDLPWRDAADMGGLISFLIVAYVLLGAFGGQP